jgi:Fe(3+) dicitrate transport protein
MPLPTCAIARAAIVVVVASAVGSRPAAAQAPPTTRDTATALGRVVVTDRADPGSATPLPPVVEARIVAGARSEAIAVAGSSANLAEKNARQVFARVPGLLVYDMDGGGNQVNVSTRGLDPHRSWEFNVRQDGVVINSDLYGYPASHYSPPLEAIERIDLVRGTAALGYGTQFGGLLDYVTKAPDRTRAAGGEVIATGGSFDLRNVFAYAGGRIGPLSYTTYAAERRAGGYRAASTSRYDAQYLRLEWDAHRQLTLRAHVGRSHYRYRIPGPLTDAQFAADPRAATRTRNWFSPDIVVPSLRADWRPTPRTHLLTQVSAVLGDRSSVQFVGFATVPDTPATATGAFAPRVVDIDRFSSWTGEARLTHEHRVLGRPATLAAGTMLSRNRLHRRQQGPGTAGDDYDLQVTGDFGRDVRYDTWNVALHAEELVRVTPRWTIIPGARVELGETRMTGRLAYYDPAETPRAIARRFPLFGARSEWWGGPATTVYGGWSQAFRPMILKDVLPENALEVTDPALRDARGWTVEAGARGIAGRVAYDLTAFEMRYDDRVGGVLRPTAGGGTVVFKTNLGSARTRGVEGTAEVRLWSGRAGAGRTFVAGAWYDARYRAGSVGVGGVNHPLAGRRVEGVPPAIVRGGLAWDRARVSVTAQVSYTAGSFADALNTRTPTPTGALGLVPAYTIADLNAGLAVSRRLWLRAGVSNLFDRRYFTKRPSFYPGPGVWPSDGRSVQVTLAARF